MGRSWFEVPFPVAIALVVLVLAALYAVLFTRLVYISLLEQHWDPRFARFRYEGAPHFHNGAEWFLLAFPAAVGWAAAIGSGWYLVRRWLRR